MFHMFITLPTRIHDPDNQLNTVQGNLEKLLQKNKEDFLPPDTKHLKVRISIACEHSEHNFRSYLSLDS